MDVFDMAWEYYKAASLVVGSSEALSKETDRETAKNNQAPYSLHWFYTSLVITYHCKHSPLIQQIVTCGKSKCILSESDSRIFPFHTFGSRKPNSAQKQAIITALCEPISVIYGPPGTGKTKVILELMHQIYSRGKTAAVVSQNSSAIENIVEKLAEIEHGSDNHLKSFAKSIAQLGNASKRGKFKDERFNFTSKENGFEKEIKAPDFLKSYPLIISTIHSLPKCFKDGTTHTYDYVIVDECSQVSPLVGMVAANNAQHLVLVGDPNQLPPVYSEETEAFIEQFIEDKDIMTGIDLRLTMRNERSFLDMGLEAIGGDRSSACILLNEHYRCHPSIIKFCNQYIYDNRLKIKSASSGYFEVPDKYCVPILVRWFEGNYGESFYSKAASRPTKRNLRQISIFMTEEWPQLLERLEKNPDLTVSVLSPYRGELESLQKAICDTLDSRKDLKDKISLQALQNTSEQEDDTENNLIMLTIHKAQGREFDIVYLLPVDDGTWEWPWSQKRRLVNVAISRAKQELRIITSINLMSEKVRKYLLSENVEAVDPATQPTAPLAKSNEDNMYIQYLIDYVFNEYNRSDQLPNRHGFGFVRSKHISIFDKHEGNTDKNISSYGGLSEPELLFAQHLAETYLARKEDTPLIANEYPLINLGADPDCTQRFDYALIDKSLEALVLAVELDGIHHRYHPKYAHFKAVNELDKKKNSFCIDKGGTILTSLKREDVEEHLRTCPSFTLLRLALDGTSQHELSSLSSERSTDFFTIDELYDRQLELIKSKGVTPVSAIIGETISALIKNKLDITQLSQELNNALKDKELIVKDRLTLLQSAPTECWRVENKGSKCGIYNALGIRKDKGYAYWVPRYNYDNEKFICHLYDKKNKE